MDFSNIRDQVSNLTLYDIKAGVRKVQNAVMNYTEMEVKVREATNNEPWGASSTLMQEVANGTHSYQTLNEIMPMIYKRFTDKSAEEWRQIYKALQLLEFLIRNGSERVIDDARTHLALIRMLRQFQYIDPNGKDQGINVRNRASELVKLLSDVDMIRAERKKARANRHKFGGIEGGGFGAFSSTGTRMQGFGSDSMTFGGAYNGGIFGDGGGFGGAPSDFQDAGPRSNRFEEYDEFETEPVNPRILRRGASPPPAPVKQEPKKPEPPKQPEPDLLDIGDDDDVPTTATATTSTAAGKQPAGGLNVLEPKAVDDDDDEFDDFQSATPVTQPAPSANQISMPPPKTSNVTTSSNIVAPQPVSGSQGPNLNGLVGLNSLTPTPNSSTISSPTSTPAFSQIPKQQPLQQKPQQQLASARPSSFQAITPNYFTSVSANSNQSPIATSRPSISSASSFTSASASAQKAKPSSTSKSGGDAFGSLWSAASAGAGIQRSSSTATSKGPNLASMAKEKASAGIWGAPSPSASSTPVQAHSRTSSTAAPKQPATGAAAAPSTGSSNLDDLLG